jgi:hypothetical protein
MRLYSIKRLTSTFLSPPVNDIGEVRKALGSAVLAVAIVSVLGAALSCQKGSPEAKGQSARATEAQALQIQAVCDSSVPIIVSKDSIGPLLMSGPIRLLRLMCPWARDTVQYGEESAHPAVVFPFPGLKVLALQDWDSLHPDQPADGWVLSGHTALLPSRVPSDASWRDLVRVYGDSIVTESGSETLGVMFCSLPGYFFDFKASEAMTPESSSRPQISNNAVPIQILIRKSLPAGWEC